MSKLKIWLVGLILLSSNLASASIYIRSYRHVPCDTWSYKGTCDFKGLRAEGAEARSVQRAIDVLNEKIEALKFEMNILSEENQEMKKLILKK